MYGMTPLLQGPAALALGGVDLSWLAGGLTAGISYLALEAVRSRRTTGQQLSSPKSAR